MSEENLKPVTFESVVENFLTGSGFARGDEINANFIKTCSKIATKVSDFRGKLVDVAKFDSATAQLGLMFLENNNVPKPWNERLIRNVVLRALAQMEIGIVKGMSEAVSGGQRRTSDNEKKIASLETLIERLNILASQSG